MSSRRARRADVATQTYPGPKGSEGGAAFSALSNHVEGDIIAGGGTGSTTAGSVVGGTTPAPSITPRVSGKILVQWSLSGTGTSAAAVATFTPTIGAYTGRLIEASAGGDAAHTIQASGQFIANGLALGTPVSANVAFASAIGFTALTCGCITMIELPG
jgi:hypothetical protein